MLVADAASEILENQSLYIITMWTNRAFPLTVSLRICSAQVQVRSQGSPCWICGGHSGNGTLGLAQSTLRVFWFPPVSYYAIGVSFHSCIIWRVATEYIDGPSCCLWDLITDSLHSCYEQTAYPFWSAIFEWKIPTSGHVDRYIGARFGRILLSEFYCNQRGIKFMENVYYVDHEFHGKDRRGDWMSGWMGAVVLCLSLGGSGGNYQNVNLLANWTRVYTLT
jgi:hypothetical protein